MNKQIVWNLLSPWHLADQACTGENTSSEKHNSAYSCLGHNDLIKASVCDHSHHTHSVCVPASRRIFFGSMFSDWRENFCRNFSALWDVLTAVFWAWRENTNVTFLLERKVTGPIGRLGKFTVNSFLCGGRCCMVFLVAYRCYVFWPPWSLGGW